jgi:Tol biopolymer transport system component
MRGSAVVALALIGVALAVAAGPVVSAQALYTPDTLVSYAGATQAEDASSPAISANGRYVAFSGSFNGVSGVWRKDLDTGELALVAGTDSQDAALSAPDAGAPSISGEGRYVSFTTTKALDPGDDPGKGCSSVYVRDMQTPIGQPGAYMLASALNGSSEGIAYAGSSASGESCPGGGSAAAGRVALSDEHEELKVVFTVIGQSDLTTGVGGAVDTPPAQVAVRDLDTDTTTLVSQTMSSLGSMPQPVPEGAAFSDEAAHSPIGASSAAISADGSTVAWLGVEIPSQAPASDALAKEGGDAPYGYPDEYAEPLWRRIADGPNVPTRRVTGGDDPLCGCTGPLATDFDPGLQSPGEDIGPEFGTYIAINSSNLGNVEAFYENITPQLSASGQMVAFLSTAPDTGEEPIIPGKNYVLTTNAFVANMASGLSRSQALMRLTGWAGNNFNDLASTGQIENIAISPEGTRIAFSTNRIDFPLSPPALITPALGQVGARQLYVANLAAGTLSLASYGYNGEPASESVVTPSFSAAGGPLAFASSATNLVYGAYNSNVFVTSEISSPAIAGVQQIGSLPASPLTPPRRELLASAKSGPHGSVLVYASVPSAGTLRANARAEVPVSVALAAKGKRARKNKRTILSSRVVASVKAVANHGGTIELKLTSARAYQALVEAHDGLYATIGLSFTTAGEITLTSTVQATFHDTPAKVVKKAEKAKSSKKTEKAKESAELRIVRKGKSGS